MASHAVLSLPVLTGIQVPQRIVKLLLLHAYLIPALHIKCNTVRRLLTKDTQRSLQIRRSFVHRAIYRQPANDVSRLRLANCPRPDPLPAPVILSPPALDRPVLGKIWQKLQK